MKSSCLLLLGILIFLNSRVVYAQDDDKLSQTDSASNALNDPVRRGADLVGIVGGPFLIFSSYRIPQTEELMAAEKRVHDLRAELYQEAPEIARLRNEAIAIQAKRTVEDSRAELAALEQTDKLLTQLEAKYGPAVGPNKIFGPETLEQVRGAKGSILVDVTNYKKGLISQSDKHALLKENRREMNGAEEASKIARRRIEDNLSAAKLDLKLTRRRVLAEEVKAPWVRRIGGAFIFIAGATDVFYAWKDSLANARIATPDELGQVAEQISADLKKNYPNE